MKIKYEEPVGHVFGDVAQIVKVAEFEIDEDDIRRLIREELLFAFKQEIEIPAERLKVLE